MGEKLLKYSVNPVPFKDVKAISSSSKIEYYKVEDVKAFLQELYKESQEALFDKIDKAL